MATLDLETALTVKLNTDATILGIIGKASRVYALTLPEAFTPPVISFQEISGVDAITHDSTASGELVNGRWQIDAWDTTQAGAERVQVHHLLIAAYLDNRSLVLVTLIA